MRESSVCFTKGKKEKIMKKLFTVLLVAALVLSSVFANGAAEKAEEKITLSVLWFNDGNESEIFEETMQDYLESHPNIELDVQVVAYADYQQKLKMMISAGEAPDVARMSTGDLVALIDQCLPLDDYVDVASIKSEYMESMLAYAYNNEGQLVALPTEATANGMLVNKTAFRNAGIDVDEVSKTWTWDEWAEIIRKVIAANDGMKYGLAVDFTPHRFSTIMYQFGGHFLNDDQTAMEFNNEGTIAALEWFKKMHDEGLIPSSVWMGSENPAELFQAGLVACHIGGSWNVNTYASNITGFEWGAVQMPSGTMRSSVPGGKLVASFKDCAHPQEAVEFMLAFADKEHSSNYDKETLNLSARTDTSVEYASNLEDFTVFTEELLVTPAYTANEWKNTSLSKVTGYAKEQIVQYLLGNIDVETCVKNVDAYGAEFFN